MNDIDIRIIKFIKKHHVLTLATSINEQSWCANCFYVFDEESKRFIFTTDAETRHGKEMIFNNNVSGAIALETSIVGKIQGVQFSGKANLISENEIKHTRNIYLKRFPIAIPFISKLLLWEIKPDFLKFTDNRLGFGKKLIWEEK